MALSDYYYSQPQHNIAPSEPQKQSGVRFEGNLLDNARKDIQEISAGISTQVGGLTNFLGNVFGVTELNDEGKAVANFLSNAARDPGQLSKDMADAWLSTYDLAVDDIGKMGLGDMVANVVSGAWKHPVSAFADALTIKSAIGKSLPKSVKEKFKKIEEQDVRVRLAEEVTQDNLNLSNLGRKFTSELDNISKKYTPETIGKGIEYIETVGFRVAPKEYIPVMQDLRKANDTYKQFVSAAGAQIVDDYSMAAKEMIARSYHTPFAELDTPKFEQTKLYKDSLNFVKKHDIRPIFHLDPKIEKGLTYSEPVSSDLLKRKYGTIDYADAGKDIVSKGEDFVSKVIGQGVADSAYKLNKKIEQFNLDNNLDVKKVDTGSSLFNNTALRELNSELKKTMLSGGIYLGANVVTTTLSILNNFDLNALKRTLKDMPKFRMADLPVAETKGLQTISKLNNFIYRPIASVDRYLERFAERYIQELKPEDMKFIQSAIPSKVVPTNVFQQALVNLVPFGRYPLAASKEVMAHLQEKPGKSQVYHTAVKAGEQTNEQIQENTQGLTEIDPTKVIRNKDGKLVQTQRVVTPVQAANVFFFGTQGDAIQIPLYTFLNELLSGKGDPSKIKINGKMYPVEHGSVTTEQGTISLIPSLSYVARSMLSPVQFYNQVLTPLMSDKYIKDDTKVFNQLVSDSQYANMGMLSRRKVSTAAREKLGKRLLGEYEYDYWKPSQSKSIQRAIMRQRMIRSNIEDSLNN